MNQHTARSIIFGPLEYGGITLPHLFALQSLSQLNLIIGHLRMQDKTGTLILILMSHLQLLVGFSTSFLHLPFPKYAKWLDHGWLLLVWQVLHRVKIKVMVRDQWLPTMHRLLHILKKQIYRSNIIE
jgi:hypothetical protein